MAMDMIRWSPLRELASLRGEMDRILGHLDTEDGSRLPRRWAPRADVIEKDDEIVITAELPGVKDEDVRVTVRDGMLTISGERRLEDEVREDRHYRLERTYGGFERTFTLPQGVREEDITAGIAYGVLRIRIPKLAASEPREVPINPGG